MHAHKFTSQHKHTHAHARTRTHTHTHTHCMVQMRLPDLELIVNLGDWPLNKNKMAAFPVFSWCGSPETRDIVWPTWDLMKSTIMGMDRSYSLNSCVMSPLRCTLLVQWNILKSLFLSFVPASQLCISCVAKGAVAWPP